MHLENSKSSIAGRGVQLREKPDQEKTHRNIGHKEYSLGWGVGGGGELKNYYNVAIQSGNSKI